jgi:hypothetical protein
MAQQGAPLLLAPLAGVEQHLQQLNLLLLHRPHHSLEGTIAAAAPIIILSAAGITTRALAGFTRCIRGAG